MSVLHTLEQQTSDAFGVLTECLNVLAYNPKLDPYNLLFKKTSVAAKSTQTSASENEEKQNTNAPALRAPPFATTQVPLAYSSSTLHLLPVFH